MSYAIPVDELSVSKIEGFRKLCKDRMIARAQELSMVTARDQLVFREALPATDLGLPAGSGYTNEDYLTGAVAANTWTLVYDTGAVAQLGTRTLIGFYKITNEDVNPQVVAVRFRKGLTGNTTLGTFSIAQFMNVKLTPEVYLSEPVIYSPQDYVFVECYARAAIGAGGEHLGFGCFVAEPVGQNIS